MSKRPKKRTKRYSGEDAKHLQAPVTSTPVVHRYTAVERSRLGQWWHEKKRLVKIAAAVIGVLLLVVWLIYELIRIIL